MSEIDPKDIEYVNVQFDTLILKEYWKKIDDICMRIGGKYFGELKTSIVHFSNTGEVKLKGCEFVTITGILKFPLKLIRANEISFSINIMFIRTIERDLTNTYITIMVQILIVILYGILRIVLSHQPTIILIINLI